MIWRMTSSVSGFESRSESEMTVTERRFIDRSLAVGVDTKDGYLGCCLNELVIVLTHRGISRYMADVKKCLRAS
jgi:hypothetical protein